MCQELVAESLLIELQAVVRKRQRSCDSFPKDVGKRTLVVVSPLLNEASRSWRGWAVYFLMNGVGVDKEERLAGGSGDVGGVGVGVGLEQTWELVEAKVVAQKETREENWKEERRHQRSMAMKMRMKTKMSKKTISCYLHFQPGWKMYSWEHCYCHSHCCWDWKRQHQQK